MTYGNGELPNGGWIPVKMSLPENNKEVLVTDGSDMFIAWYTNSEWRSHSDLFSPYTHPIVAWMPLPELYKVESEETE